MINFMIFQLSYHVCFNIFLIFRLALHNLNNQWQYGITPLSLLQACLAFKNLRAQGNLCGMSVEY
uniref:Uncharacterized protein n=1 Tax=Arundo donax TaxID=35708 RepID=A0A0A8Z6M1_ARUDO